VLALVPLISALSSHKKVAKLVVRASQTHGFKTNNAIFLSSHQKVAKT
jgi:hypothetical protein